MSRKSEEKWKSDLKYSSVGEKSSCSSNGRRVSIDEALDNVGFGRFHFVITFFSGWILLVNGIWVMMITVLSPAVKCIWSLSAGEEALITSMLFLGYFVGTTFWGYFGDRFGRKKALACVNIVLLVSAILSSLKLTSDDARWPGYIWFLMCRFGVGFGAPGTEVAAVYYIEFLPRKCRGVWSVALIAWWGVGAILGSVLALVIMGYLELSWHWFLGIACVPVALIFLSLPLIPESPRWYLSKGRLQNAEKVIRKICGCNIKLLPPGPNLEASVTNTSTRSTTETTTEVMESTKEIRDGNTKEKGYQSRSNSLKKEGSQKDFNSGKIPLLQSKAKTDNVMSLIIQCFACSRLILPIKGFSNLCVNRMWRSTVPIILLWFGASWLYIGGSLLATVMLLENPHCNVIDKDSGYFNSSQNQTDVDIKTCENSQLNIDEYLKIIWMSLAEIPGIIFPIIFVELLGRKLTMLLNLFLTMVGFCFLFICAGSTGLTIFFIFIRTFTQGFYKVICVYTAEIYPTSVRSLGVGVSSSMSRLGAVITPYVAQVLFEVNDYAAISVYTGSCLILIILVITLPKETKGKSLKG